MNLETEYRWLRRRLSITALLLISFGSFCGAGIAWTVGQRQQVIKVVETQTKVETKEVPQKSCLDGHDGIVVAGHSEHVSIGDDNDWTYGNVITFDVDGINRVCYWEGPQDMSKNFIIGQKYHPYGGTPM